MWPNQNKMVVSPETSSPMCFLSVAGFRGSHCGSPSPPTYRTRASPRSPSSTTLERRRWVGVFQGWFWSLIVSPELFWSIELIVHPEPSVLGLFHNTGFKPVTFRPSIKVCVVPDLKESPGETPEESPVITDVVLREKQTGLVTQSGLTGPLLCKGPIQLVELDKFGALNIFMSLFSVWELIDLSCLFVCLCWPSRSVTLTGYCLPGVYSYFSSTTMMLAVLILRSGERTKKEHIIL